MALWLKGLNVLASDTSGSTKKTTKTTTPSATLSSGGYANSQAQAQKAQKSQQTAMNDLQRRQQEALQKAVADQNAQANARKLVDITDSETPKGGNPPADNGLVGGGGGVSYASVGSNFVASDSYYKAMAYTQGLLDKLSSGRTSYTDKINNTLSAIENYGKFSYDMNKDPLFQNALASAMKSGQTAMQDTIGQASALTGGYGNSYAVSAGNQAYNQMIEGAYDSLPEYYQIAKDAYEGELNNMYKQLSAYGDLDKTEYDRLANAYNANLQNVNSIYDREYNDFWNNKNFAEQQRQFSAEMGYKNAKLQQEQANWEKEYELSLIQANNKASSNSSAGKKSVEDVGKTLVASANKNYFDPTDPNDPTIGMITDYANLYGIDPTEAINYVLANMDEADWNVVDGKYTDQWGHTSTETPTFTISKKQNQADNNEYVDNKYGKTYTKAQLQAMGFKVK